MRRQKQRNKQSLIIVNIPEQLILQARLGDGEVDDSYLDAYFRQIVRVRQFSCHVKPSRRKNACHYIKMNPICTVIGYPSELLHTVSR